MYTRVYMYLHITFALFKCSGCVYNSQNVYVYIYFYTRQYVGPEKQNALFNITS